jgi:hypothetical protein
LLVLAQPFAGELDADAAPVAGSRRRRIRPSFSSASSRLVIAPLVRSERRASRPVLRRYRSPDQRKAVSTYQSPRVRPSWSSVSPWMQSTRELMASMRSTIPSTVQSRLAGRSAVIPFEGVVDVIAVVAIPRSGHERRVGEISLDIKITSR